jgi:hypothetical protein
MFTQLQVLSSYEVIFGWLKTCFMARGEVQISYLPTYDLS